MKKVLSIVTVAAIAATFVACGPSKEEMEATAKRQSDSLAAIEKAKQDSVAAAEAEQAKIAEANAARIADSTKVADSLAAAANAKGGKKK